MAQLLGNNAHLVSYGAMSKEPLSLPTSLFIFKNLTCHGFWQTRWYSGKSLEQRQELLKTLTALVRDGKVRSLGLNDARIPSHLGHSASGS
jgi:trans-2-enoyl-CoA reductase